MLEIRLHHHLGRLFCESVTVKVSTVTEALRSLCSNFEGFRDYLETSAKAGTSYQFFVNGSAIEIWQMGALLPENATLVIAPVIGGAGNTFRIIAGVALLGLGIAGVGFLSFTPSTMMITGTALLLSAFHGRQKAPGDEKNRRSLIFGGSQTTNREGGRVPIIYGIPFVGGMIVSAAIKTTYTPLGGSSGGGGKGGK